MYLSSLKLNNWRNYASFKRRFLNKTVVFVGENAVGKTNLIEAIRFLSLFKSFRGQRAQDLIKWQAEFARVNGEIADDQVRHDIVGVLEDNPETNRAKRLVQINGAKRPTRQAVGQLLTVLFSPDDIQLISSSPNKRRKYLDAVIGQLNRRYHEALLDYQRALEQRNALLSGDNSQAQIAIWDEQLAKSGGRLLKERSAYIENLNAKLSNIYQSLGGQGDLEIVYQPNLRLPGLETLLAESELAKLLQKSLQANFQKDCYLETTSGGPHRDDFIFELRKKNIATHGSRGEFRSAVLALKLAEKEYIAQATKKTPVLLLDDVFSELDQNHRRALSAQVQKTQTFITTTDLDSLAPELVAQAEIIKLPNKT
ncbi:DNA replication/repair protein RecF [Patescibacteria group bacterium]